jgi:hypothetical protein
LFFKLPSLRANQIVQQRKEWIASPRSLLAMASPEKRRNVAVPARLPKPIGRIWIAAQGIPARDGADT